MRPYVSRVLPHPANWLVYSTALLERSWLDFESLYGRERAVMQIQVCVCVVWCGVVCGVLVLCGRSMVR